MRNIKILERELKLSGNVRNAAWMIRQFSKRRIVMGGIIISQRLFNQYKICMKVISDIYENKWDVDFTLTQINNKIYINIKAVHILFEEIVITNSRANTHTIKDLLVAIELRNDNNRGLKVGSLKGGRLSLTYAEFQSNYFHSHLSVDCQGLNTSSYQGVPFFTTFCTGSGEINIYQSNINGDGFTERNFIAFAMQIMTLVTWESIEGMPYRHMDNIRIKPSSGSYFYHSENQHSEPIYRKLLTNLIENQITPDIDVIFNSNNSFEVVDNEKISKLANELPFTADEKAIFLCSPVPGTNNIHYYRYNSTPGFNSVPTFTSNYIFRGELRQFTVGSAPAANATTTAEIQYKLHPNVIKYVKKKLEYELNKKRIRQSTINRYKVKPSDAGESVQSDPVPVPGNS